jgi:hypothetical protein
MEEGGEIIYEETIIPDISADIDLINEDVFISIPAIGYTINDEPIYPDPASTDPIGETLPPAVVPDIPSINLVSCSSNVYIDSNVIARLKDITVSWNPATGAEYYQVFLIEDDSTSLNVNVKGVDAGNYANGPLFKYQSGPITGLTYTLEFSGSPKRINAFIFAYSSAGRSSFPLTMATFIASDKVGNYLKTIYLERTSYVYKPGFCLNFDDQTIDLGGATQNLASYPAGVTKVDAPARPLTPEFNFRGCKAYIIRETAGDPTGWIDTMSISWFPVLNATGYQVYFTTNHNELYRKEAIEDPDYDDTKIKESYSLGPLFFHQSGILNKGQTFYYYKFDPGMFTKCSVFVFAYNELGRGTFPTTMLSAIANLEIGSGGLLAVERTRYADANGDITTVDNNEVVDFQANNLNIITTPLS